MKSYTNEELCLIFIDSFVGLEYKNKQVLYSLIKGKSNIKSVLNENREKIISLIGENAFSTILTSACDDYLKFVLGEYKKKNIVCITIESKDYPSLYKESALPPLVLYCKGKVELLSSNVFGIVGSRKSLPLSINLTKDYVKATVSAGFTLITGIAEGVDQTVIETALACGGKVISVIAGGLDNIYPTVNTTLVDKIVEAGGLVFSESVPEVKPLPYLFPVRNRLIAYLSRGVLIVSASKKSGALYTAEYAIECGKDLFCVPYSVGVPSGAGCNDLIKQGALLTDDPKDILDFYGVEIKEEKLDLSSSEREIIEILKDQSLHIDAICQKLNKQIFEVMSVLSILEIKGMVVSVGVNVYALSTKGLEE